jgi:hypothetical protein
LLYLSLTSAILLFVCLCSSVSLVLHTLEIPFLFIQSILSILLLVVFLVIALGITVLLHDLLYSFTTGNEVLLVPLTHPHFKYNYFNISFIHPKHDGM